MESEPERAEPETTGQQGTGQGAAGPAHPAPGAAGPGAAGDPAGPQPPGSEEDLDAGPIDAALPELPDGRRWSMGARITIAATVAAVVVGVGFHLAMVFLHVAPSNTLYKQNSGLVDSYVYPEFEQNWKLFAPNPLQQNVAVQARVQVLLPHGDSLTTGWVDLTAKDASAIKHNPAPSHVDQNLLRRAYDFYTDSHDQSEKPIGPRGQISADYLRRIAAHRMGRHLNGGIVEKMQLRSVSTPVPPAKWSNETINTNPTTRVLPWWTVTPKDFR